MAQLKDKLEADIGTQNSFSNMIYWPVNETVSKSDYK